MNQLNPTRIQIIHLVNEDFGPSAMMEAVLKSVARLRPRVSLKQLPLENAENLIEILNVRSEPSVLILHDGRPVTQFRGLMSRKKLCALLDEIQTTAPVRLAS